MELLYILFSRFEKRKRERESSLGDHKYSSGKDIKSLHSKGYRED